MKFKHYLVSSLAIEFVKAILAKSIIFINVIIRRHQNHIPAIRSVYFVTFYDCIILLFLFSHVAQTFKLKVSDMHSTLCNSSKAILGLLPSSYCIYSQPQTNYTQI